MIRPFKSVAYFLGAAMATTLVIATFNFLVDPLQLFGRRGFIRPSYTSDSRLQNAGLIRSQDFDAVLMGTSLSVHLRQGDIDRNLGVHSVKLAMSGSTSVEQSFVLRAALERKPRLVIWELDDRAFFSASDIDSDEFIQADLYRRNLSGITRYLLSLDTARESLWIALSQIRPLKTIAHALAAAQYLKFYGNEVDEIGALAANVDVTAIYNASRLRAAFAVSEKYPKTIYARYNYDDMVRNFDRDFMSVIDEHPDMTFCIFVPPYSILQFVTIRDVAPEAVQTIYDFSVYAFNRLTEASNVVLFDFRDIEEITHDLDNYMDLLHYTPAVDQRLLSFLATGEHAVDRAAPFASLDRLRKQIADFDSATVLPHSLQTAGGGQERPNLLAGTGCRR